VSVAASLLFFGVLLLLATIYRAGATPSYRCFFCGTRTGEHEPSCPWRRRR
jgi:hypothetical protein